MRTLLPDVTAAWWRPRQPPVQPASGRTLLAVGAVVMALMLLPIWVDAKAFAPWGAALMVSAQTSGATLSYLLAVGGRSWRRVAELGLRTLPREAGLGALLGTLACAVALGLLWVGTVALGLRPVIAEGTAGAWGAFLLSRNFAVVEEILFRGVLLRWLIGRLPTNLALLIQAVLFGVAHVSAGPVAMFFAALMGLAFGWCFLWRRSLWTPIALHFVWDFFTIMVASRLSIDEADAAAAEAASGVLEAVGVSAHIAAAAVMVVLTWALHRRAQSADLADTSHTPPPKP